LRGVLVVNRFRVPDDAAEAFRSELDRALATLAACPGHLDGRIGRNVDEPTLWVLVTTWEGPGAYRRALSSYDVKLHAVPVLGRAVDEPGAYEVVDPETVVNVASPRSLG
jgi:quinol monooxygenase YgiN